MIFAAEITLFISDVHFEATIMVALTCNLVMYTLFVGTPLNIFFKKLFLHYKPSILRKATFLSMYLLAGINSSLPVDSHVKMIDIWFIHGLLMPFIVFVLLVATGFINESTQGKKSYMAASFLKGCRIVVIAISITFVLMFFFVSRTFGSEKF